MSGYPFRASLPVSQRFPRPTQKKRSLQNQEPIVIDSDWENLAVLGKLVIIFVLTPYHPHASLFHWVTVQLKFPNKWWHVRKLAKINLRKKIEFDYSSFTRIKSIIVMIGSWGSFKSFQFSDVSKMMCAGVTKVKTNDVTSKRFFSVVDTFYTLFIT